VLAVQQTNPDENKQCDICLPVCGALWWVLLQHSYYVVIIFHRQVWCRALSLHHACIRCSGTILIPTLPLCKI